MMNGSDLLNMTLAEVTECFAAENLPRYRAKQVYEWLLKGRTYEQMHNLPAALRQMLAHKYPQRLPQIDRKLVSRIDGTVKYLFSLHDGQKIESVVMKYEHGYSICISCQAGCRMGCGFCASTLKGLARNLEPSEMLGQIIVAQRDLEIRISNVVMMGIGEPMDNFEHVIRFLALVNADEGLKIGYRHISVSTCGVVDGIYRLAEYDLPITLSVSLHFTDNVQRSEMMPVNRKWNIHALLTACSFYFKKTGRRISFEFTLIKGKNDTVQNAKELACLLKTYMGDRTPMHVNLIPVNEVSERGWIPSDRNSVTIFCKTLNDLGVNATVRRKLGSDVNASCGQLRFNEG